MPKRRRLCAEETTDAAFRTFSAWTNSFKKVSKWLAQYDLEQLLNDNDGIVQLTDFLPAKVAEGALYVLQQISEVPFMHAACTLDVTITAMYSMACYAGCMDSHRCTRKCTTKQYYT